MSVELQLYKNELFLVEFQPPSTPVTKTNTKILSSEICRYALKIHLRLQLQLV